MNLKALFPSLTANAETLLLSTALHYATAGKVTFSGMDADAMAIGLFSVISQLEAEHPGISAKYGWQRSNALQTP